MSLQRNISHSGEYQEVALAFVDILGFGQLVNRRGADTPDYLLGLFGKIYSSKLDWPPSVIQRRVISDSIIMWATTREPVGILALSTLCVEMQNTFFEEGILIRGAITFGKHYTQIVTPSEQQSNNHKAIDDEIIISEALIDASNLEKNIIFPKILISDKIKAQIEPVEEEYKSWITSMWHLDSDNDQVINGLYGSRELKAVNMSYSESLFAKNWPDKTPSDVARELRDDAVDCLRNRVRIISENLSHKDHKVREKWKYICREHNSFIQKTPKTSNIPKSLMINDFS